MADDDRSASEPGMDQGDRHQMMENMSYEERQAIRKRMRDRHEKVMKMSAEERRAMLEKRSEEGSWSQ